MRALRTLCGFILLSLLAVFPACKGNNNSISLGTISVNGPGIDGTVPAGNKRLYTLSGIKANSYYMLRTVVMPDADLTVDIYQNEDEYNIGVPSLATGQRGAVDILWSGSTSTTSTITTLFFEAPFTAPTSDSYVVVIGSPAGPGSKDEFFYDLRLMSPDELQAFDQSSASGNIGAGQLHIYSGGTATQPGSYTINLTSTVTTTAASPQLFVYKDASLDLTNSLLYSSVTDSANFWFTDLNTRTTVACPDCTQGTDAAIVIIHNVPFSSGTTTGPYIVVKGTSTANYVLTIQNP